MAIHNLLDLPIGSLVSYGFYKQLVFGGFREDGTHVRLYDAAGDEKQIELSLFYTLGNLLEDQVVTTPPSNSHVWNDVGERCIKCGDKDWFAGAECSGTPVPPPEPKGTCLSSKLDFSIELLRELVRQNAELKEELRDLRTIVDARGQQYGSFQRPAYNSKQCLACGQQHVGFDGLPCPNMRATS